MCNFNVDMELPKATNTSALSGAGMMRLFNKVGETVNKITYKMDENDPVSTFPVIKTCISIASILFVLIYKSQVGVE